jgi:hypothetical protein
MSQGKANLPNVWLVGDVDHSDFAEAIELVRETASVGPGLPEVIVLAQSRPGSVGLREIMNLRRSAPLAGFVALLGSWCEGETRTGRPAASIERKFWYEFPQWWRRQLEIRGSGRCPEWVNSVDGRSFARTRLLADQRVAIAADAWDTAAAIADVVADAGGEAVWTARGDVPIEDCTVGIWDGGQLNEQEAEGLAAFCGELHRQHASVIALLDFPRRDRQEAARAAGAEIVLGKPYVNADLVEAIRQATATPQRVTEAA